MDLTWSLASQANDPTRWFKTSNGRQRLERAQQKEKPMHHTLKPLSRPRYFFPEAPEIRKARRHVSTSLARTKSAETFQRTHRPSTHIGTHQHLHTQTESIASASLNKERSTRARVKESPVALSSTSKGSHSLVFKSFLVTAEGPAKQACTCVSFRSRAVSIPPRVDTSTNSQRNSDSFPDELQTISLRMNAPSFPHSRQSGFER